jgi:hypothetical protein
MPNANTADAKALLQALRRIRCRSFVRSRLGREITDLGDIENRADLLLREIFVFEKNDNFTKAMGKLPGWKTGRVRGFAVRARLDSNHSRQVP